MKTILFAVALASAALSVSDASATHVGTCGYDTTNTFSCDDGTLRALSASPRLGILGRHN